MNKTGPLRAKRESFSKEGTLEHQETQWIIRLVGPYNGVKEPGSGLEVEVEGEGWGGRRERERQGGNTCRKKLSRKMEDKSLEGQFEALSGEG